MQTFFSNSTTTAQQSTFHPYCFVLTRSFLSSAKVSDIKEVYLYLTRAEGRRLADYKPSCLDPLQAGEDRLLFRLKEKSDLLGRFLLNKLMQRGDQGRKTPLGTIKELTWKSIRGGFCQLRPRISIEGVRFATKDLPSNKAPGPDQAHWRYIGDARPCYGP